MWGDLASHKRLFNPPPQFLRLGTWCPALMSCMNACEYVFMYVVCIISGDRVLGDLVFYQCFYGWYAMNNGFMH